MIYLTTCKLMNSVVLNIIRKIDSTSRARVSKEKAFYFAGLDGSKDD